MNIRLLAAVLSIALPASALAGEACIVVLPGKPVNNMRAYDIWLERGPSADLNYAWTCEAKNDTGGTATSSNSSSALLKPDEDDRLGSCSATTEAGGSVAIAVDLSVTPEGGAEKKLKTMNFRFNPLKEEKSQRQCRGF